MPSRSVVAVIVLFWLAMAGWYVAREIAPLWNAEDVPPFHIDLTDEVGAPSIDWRVTHKGKKVGQLTSSVRRLDVDLFELRGDMRFSDFKVPVLEIFTIEMRKVETRYRVTATGKLVEMSVGLSARSAVDIHVVFAGKVAQGIWKPNVVANDVEVPSIPGFDGLKLPANGSILNTMLPLNRIPGLAVGKTWRVPLLDIAGDVSEWLKNAAVIGELEAVVAADTLKWHDEEVDCFKIEYREPGKDAVAARTWVRRLDGIVLKQEAERGGMDLVLIREPKKF